ncbi:hypothetical protein SAMN00777080_4556 [Aquiflexum balticum DSM 16537]|uniref:Lipoprotein n=1 Tax=Aquiflexum balticum DSM 16537 TaxID=758820 RepID=A0A1W2HAI5_9BACT|nr:hypothetical protein [Aquiflexum balticum]SMD45883.1 hypothetical protein SAMN00777080_4556 [Aquiflexum balticum DSM 16537]
MSIKKNQIKLYQVRKVKICALTFLVVILSISCMEQNNQICEDSTPVGSDITALFVDDFNCTLKKLTEQDQVTFKIRSQNELVEWLSCGSSLPDIDFDQEFIFGGRIKSYKCGHLNELVAENWCDNLKVKVIIQPQDCMAITDVYFFVALPIEYVKYDLKFDIINLDL